MPIFTILKYRQETPLAEIFYPIVLPTELWSLFVNIASIPGQVWAGKRKRNQKSTFIFLHSDAPHFIKIKDFLRRTIVKVGMRVDSNVFAAFLTLDAELLFSACRFFHASSLSDRCQD